MRNGFALKKFISLLLILTVVLCSACAKTEPVEPAAETTEDPVETESTVEVTQEPVVEEEPLPAPPDVDINSWEFLYAGISQGVGRYEPQLGFYDNQYMDIRCIDQTAAFLQAAREAGYSVWINSGYRNWEYRINWYERYINEYGSSFEAAKHVFPAGCSEHHTGLAFCVTDESALHANYYEQYDQDIAGTELYNWMIEHCTEYGFILRYPKGHEEHYERACENAAHFRYVGVEAAEYITENGICFEEFLELYED